MSETCVTRFSFDGTDNGTLESGDVTVEPGCSSLSFNMGESASINFNATSISAPLTYELWIYPTSFPSSGNRAILQDSGYAFFLELKSNGICGNSNTPVVYSGGQSICGEELRLNQWNHVAVTFSSTGEVFYWSNGNLGNSSTINYAPTGTSGTVYLGAENGGGNTTHN